MYFAEQKLNTFLFSRFLTFLSTTVMALVMGSEASPEAFWSGFVQAEGIIQQQQPEIKNSRGHTTYHILYSPTVACSV